MPVTRHIACGLYKHKSSQDMEAIFNGANPGVDLRSDQCCSAHLPPTDVVLGPFREVQVDASGTPLELPEH